MRGMAHIAEQGQEAEQQGIGRQQGRVLADGVGAGRGEDAGQGVRIHEGGQRRAEGQRGIGHHLAVAQQQAARALGLEGVVGRLEHGAVAAQLPRDQRHRGQHRDVDHDVLDEGDQGRRPQARGIGVERQDDEGDRQRQLAGQPQRLDHRGHADQLQRDVGHHGEDAGDGDRQLQPARAVLAEHHVAGGDVAMLLRPLPQLRHHQEDEGIDDDGVGQGEEAVGADGVDQRRHRDHGVGGVEIAADQEPGDPGAELAAAQPPFVDMGQRLAALPAGGHEAHDGDQDEKEGEDRERDDVQLSRHDARSDRRSR
ncbi:hypothetical protein QFZ27_007465 [Inquilinus ginsengisoli]